jgi:hypothetical protein
MARDRFAASSPTLTFRGRITPKMRRKIAMAPMMTSACGGDGDISKP